MSAAEVAAVLGYVAEPASWDLGITEPVPMARWGKDHWTTFAYVETRWVDHAGALSHDQMRCDRQRHPAFYGSKRRATAFGTDCDGSRYATRLKTEQPRPDGTWDIAELPGHDDYDCLADAIREGLIEVTMPAPAANGADLYLDARGKPVRMADGLPIAVSGPMTGYVESWLMTAASYSLTARGQVIAGQLRAHMAVTRQSHQFVPSEES
jgi:hypothetical protein